MISRQEILDFSREFGLSAHIIEKDYVLYWLLAGIANHAELSSVWIFKGGTCLKKCYFETYRFSEDLDFTIMKNEHINQEFLVSAFLEIAAWVYEKSGIEIPSDAIRFEIFKNPRGSFSAEGRIYYRGPLQQRKNLPRIKLDLTPDEVLVLDSVRRSVHHPYSDKLGDEYTIQCYSLAELYAEKIRALSERLRPRDLYDVIHFYRRSELEINRELVVETLKKKCDYRDMAVPTMEILANKPELEELKAEWNNMLAHQLPVLPPFEQYWQELPAMFDWLYHRVEKVVPSTISTLNMPIDETWTLPVMAQAWNISVPLEIIRSAAANRLCVDLKYQNSKRLIEPYSLRRTKTGDLLLYAVKHNTGEVRSYRIDRIQAAEATGIPFIPKFLIEISITGSLAAPPKTNVYHDIVISPHRKPARRHTSGTKSYFGPKFIIECPFCHKKFTKKTLVTKLNPHKDKNGYPCPGRRGIYIETKY